MDKARELEDRLARVERGYSLEVLVGMCHDAANQLATYRRKIAELEGENDGRA